MAPFYRSPAWTAWNRSARNRGECFRLGSEHGDAVPGRIDDRVERAVPAGRLERLDSQVLAARFQDIKDSDYHLRFSFRAEVYDAQRSAQADFLGTIDAGSTASSVPEILCRVFHMYQPGTRAKAGTEKRARRMHGGQQDACRFDERKIRLRAAVGIVYFRNWGRRKERR